MRVEDALLMGHVHLACQPVFVIDSLLMASRSLYLFTDPRRERGSCSFVAQTHTRLRNHPKRLELSRWQPTRRGLQISSLVGSLPRQFPSQQRPCRPHQPRESWLLDELSVGVRSFLLFLLLEEPSFSIERQHWFFLSKTKLGNFTTQSSLILS
jgi:hypothetical protein